MKIKTTIFLILLNILTFYGIYYLDQGKEARQSQTGKAKLFGNSLAGVDYIHIEGKALDYPRTLRRNNTTWEITDPINWPANLFAVQRIITQLEFLEPEVSFSVDEIEKSGQTLADYGLDSPNLVITVGSKTIRIGKSTNMGNRLYVLDPNEENIFVIKEAFFEGLASSLDELANSKVFDIPFYALDAIKIHLIEPHSLTIRLSKQNKNWAFEAPIQAHANNNLVNDLINKLTTLKVEEFNFKTENSKTKISNPSLRLTLQSNNQRKTLSIGRADDDKTPNSYLAQLEDNPTLFTISGDTVTALKEAQEALREKRFIPIDKEALSHIKISLDSKQSIDLQKLENKSWQVASKMKSNTTQTLPADTETIQELVQSLQELEALEFVSDAPSSSDLKLFGLNEPQRTIKLSSVENASTLVLGSIEQETGHLYAKLEEAPFVYKVSPRILGLVSISPLKFQTRTLKRLPEATQINGIRIKDLSNNKMLVEERLENTNQAWNEKLKALPAERQESINALLNNIRHFKVKEYLQDHFTENVALDPQSTLPWQYRMEVDMYLPGQDSTETSTEEFFFTKRIGGELQIGGSKAKNTIFSLKQDWIDSLSELASDDN